jgi:hypothetical protein
VPRRLRVSFQGIPSDLGTGMKPLPNEPLGTAGRGVTTGAQCPAFGRSLPERKPVVQSTPEQSEDVVPAELSEPEAVPLPIATREPRSPTTTPKVDRPPRRSPEPLLRFAVRPPRLAEAEQRRPRVEPLVPSPVAVLRTTARCRHAHRETVVRRPAFERCNVSRACILRDVGYDLTIRRLPRGVEVRPVRFLGRSAPREGQCDGDPDQEETHSPVMVGPTSPRMNVLRKCNSRAGMFVPRRPALSPMRWTSACLLAEADAERWPRASARWLGRLIIESPAITLNEVVLAVAAMQGLEGPDRPLAVQSLKHLASRHRNTVRGGRLYARRGRRSGSNRRSTSASRTRNVRSKTASEMNRAGVTCCVSRRSTRHIHPSYPLTRRDVPR